MLVFLGMLIVGLIYVYFLVPETRGITLEEVTTPRFLSLSCCPVSCVPHRSTSCTGLVSRLGAQRDGSQARSAIVATYMRSIFRDPRTWHERV